MIYVVTNNKGGVGKSLTATVLASVLADSGRNFKLIEIDDHNSSLQFSNSQILNEKNMQTIKLDKKDENIEKIFFEIMSDPNLDYIIDIGGSHNTDAVIPILKEVDFQKIWIIPVIRVKKYIENADTTADLINDPGNTIFLLNQYSILESIEDDFLYFFGNKNLGVQKESKYFDANNYLAIPFSNAFQFSEDEEQTIFDLLQIASEVNPAAARKLFFEQAAGDQKEYLNLMSIYRQSKIALDIFEEIKNNFSKIIA